ncbi:MAG: glycerophosphodiester phosphodiesterase [Candidatus Nanopelagicaceae bacterium]|nr:glycerophosphodiester phosphodiesterase [Candidatus Nanopelagicaceae bacterium]
MHNWQVKIFAHRGFSHRYPEATRLAYEKALEVGADGFECDVRLTKDKKVVCFHDRNLRRVGNLKKAVSRTTLTEMQEKVSAISLNELLDIAIANGIDLLIETKHPVLSGGAIEKAVIKLLDSKTKEIKEAKIEIRLMSFSRLAVRRMKKSSYPTMKVIKYSLGFLIRPTKDIAVAVELLRNHPGLITRNSSNRTYVWTVNSREDLRWLKKKGVYAVITDRPKRARRILLPSRNG